MGERKKTDYIIEKELNAKYTKHYEGAFAQGSGYLHIRGSYEEGLLCAGQDEEYMRMPANVTIEKPRHPRSKCGTYVPGITGIHPLLKEELVNLPNPLCVGITAEGIPLDMDTCEIRDYERRLCLADGVLEREFVWDLGHGKSLACHYVRYVSRTVRSLIVQKIRLTGLGGDIPVEFVSDIDEKVKTNGYQHFVRTEKHPVAGGCLVEIETDNKDCVRMVSKAAAYGRYFEEKEGRAYNCIVYT